VIVDDVLKFIAAKPGESQGAGCPDEARS
jgi:hypothetical protein